MKKLLFALLLTLMPMGSADADLLVKTGDPTLISPETGVDYNQLEELLADEKWREANDKTLELILQAAGRDAQGWLSQDDLETIACWDLKTIDKLWKYHSNGHFGFSVQVPIFIETGNKPGKLFNEQAYQDFGMRVGWRDEDDWVAFKQNLNYSLDAPDGHLPFLRDEYEINGARLKYVFLAQRIVECGIPEDKLGDFE